MQRLLLKKKTPIYLFAFFAVELTAWLCVLFLSIDWTHVLSYSAVALSFFFALSLVEIEADTLLTIGGLFFTCIADIFLVLLHKEGDTLAMCIFLCAQICYAGRTWLLAKNKGEKWVQVGVRVALSIAGGLITWLVLREKTQAVFVISVVYYVNLLCSIVFSFLHFGYARAKFMAFGFLSFAFCDLSIGFDFLVDIFSLPPTHFIPKLLNANVPFVHLFYPPSQALIGASVYPEYRKK